MAEEWIKMRHDLRDDPGVIGIASELGLEDDTVVGKLHALWSWAVRHLVADEQGNGNAPSVTTMWVDRYLNVTGFADAMIHVDWLREDGQGVVIPRMSLHIDKSAKRRALQRRRTEKHRAECNAPSVTKVLPPARKKEKEKENSTSSFRRSRARVEDVAISEHSGPEFETDEFKAAWAGWVANRKEIGKPMTERAAKMQLAKLKDIGHDRAISAIEHSIANGWQGIFEPSGRGGGSGTYKRQAANPRDSKPTAEDRGEYPEPDRPPPILR